MLTLQQHTECTTADLRFVLFGSCFHNEPIVVLQTELGENVCWISKRLRKTTELRFSSKKHGDEDDD